MTTIWKGPSMVRTVRKQRDDAMLRAIVADPSNDLPRLAYADWLDEAGDDEQAAFIREGLADPDAVQYVRAEPYAVQDPKSYYSTSPYYRAWAGLEIGWSLQATVYARRGFDHEVRSGDTVDVYTKSSDSFGGMFELTPYLRLFEFVSSLVSSGSPIQSVTARPIQSRSKIPTDPEVLLIDQVVVYDLYRHTMVALIDEVRASLGLAPVYGIKMSARRYHLLRHQLYGETTYDPFPPYWGSSMDVMHGILPGVG